MTGATGHLLRFGDVALPWGNPSTPLGGFEPSAPIVELPRGVAFDELGDARARQRFPYELVYRAVLDCDSMEELDERINEYRALVGVVDDLYRFRSGLQFCRARLMRFEATRETHNRLALPVEFTFRVQSYWHGRPRGYEETNIGTGSPKSFTLHNGGNLPQSDVQMRIMCGGVSTPTITAVSVYRSGYSEVNWTGTIAFAEYLDIDFGARSVQLNGIDAYDGFEATDYDREEWLVLDPGDNTVYVAWTAGSGTVTPTIIWQFYDRWA